MSRRNFTYTVVFEADAETGSICASVPALELASHGRNLVEARSMIREALELHLEGLLEEEMPVPEDLTQVEQMTVEVAVPATVPEAVGHGALT